MKSAYKKGVAISLLAVTWGSTKGSALAFPTAQSSLVEKEDIITGMHLRGGDRAEHGSPDLSNEVVLAQLNQDLIKLFSDIDLEDDIKNDVDTLKTSAQVLAKLKDHISDPQVQEVFPSSFHPILKTLVRQLTNAEKKVKEVEHFASQYYLTSEHKPHLDHIAYSHRHLQLDTSIKSSEGSRQRRLLGHRASLLADYHMRSRTRQPLEHHSIIRESAFSHQQGYHPARQPREDGKHRRLNGHEEKKCVNVDLVERKTDQCFRLANCARNYNLYDLFVYTFGDDIEFDTGSVDDKEKIKAEDEVKLVEKLTRIKEFSSDIIDNDYNEEGVLFHDEILDPNGTCDQLLQEFHRFDEDLSVKGKWQGGSVTGVCRGWGTSRFMSLEAIYYISDTVLGLATRVETCIEDLVDEFNRKLENFTIPDRPCEDDFINQITGDFVEFYGSMTANDTIDDIKQKFSCLYFSFLAQTGGNCTAKPQCDSSACEAMRLKPVFEAKDKWGVGFFDYIFGYAYLYEIEIEGPYFEYDIPAVLRSREDRFKKDSFGAFLLDYAPVKDLTAETFIVKVFNEFVGCAADLVRILNDEDHPIFSTNDGLFNPYAPDEDHQEQFQLPITINDNETDAHGQLKSEYLDLIFEYIKVGEPGEGEELEDTGPNETPKLTGALKEFLAEAFFIDQGIDEIAYFEDLKDQDDCGYCDEILDNLLYPLRDKFSALGLDRTSLDQSIALFFGNKTTIGQVCSYARGLEDETVEDLPGFCCLDAPYESSPEWGEKFDCDYYITLTDGSTKVVPKGPVNCTRLGPVTSGFNEAACDVFHGTWCPTPRNCSDLVNCVKDAIEEVEISRDRQAFLEYLNDAPSVDDPTDSKTCGDLREYFEYDRNYPDDDRICREVLDLQCFTDFENLDGFATGTAGPDSTAGLTELAVSEKVKLISKDPFDASLAKAWKIINKGLEVAVTGGEYGIENADDVQKACTVFISAIAGTSAACTFLAILTKKWFEILIKILKGALFISKKLFEFIVDKQNAAFEADRKNSIYTNIVTNHGNIITTFYATQQLKVMLGEISDGIAEQNEEGEERRRRLTEDCVHTAIEGFKIPCELPSCEDWTRICDGSFNFPYVAYLKGAGCDDLDSDGDGVYDVCEDRYRPEIVVRDASIFRGDKFNTSRLYHDDTIFNDELLVRNFLNYEFPATDDCQPTDKLSVIIERVEDTFCRDTRFILTPQQDVPDCDNVTDVGDFHLNYTNPLNGTSRNVTVVLDEDPPGVECGFGKPSSSSINAISVDNKTLYHYMLKTDGDGLQLTDSNFWYSVHDNCHDDVNVKIVVKSNEIQQNSIAETFTYHTPEVTATQATVLYAPSTCENVGLPPNPALFCKKNPLAPQVRAYNIIVTATDSAGNSASDECKIVMVSSCKPPTANCEKHNTKGNPQAENFYYSKTFAFAEANEEQTLYKVAEEDLVWKPE